MTDELTASGPYQHLVDANLVVEIDGAVNATFSLSPETGKGDALVVSGAFDLGAAGEFTLLVSYDKNGRPFDRDIQLTGGVAFEILGVEVSSSVSMSGDQLTITLPDGTEGVYAPDVIRTELRFDLEAFFSPDDAETVANALADIQQEFIETEEFLSGIIPKLPGLDAFDDSFKKVEKLSYLSSNIDVLTGSDFSDYFSAGGGNDQIDGGGGTDIIFGDDGNDTLSGGDGNDRVSGDGGADEIRGGAGNDFIFFDNLDAVLDGGAGFDIGVAVSSSEPLLFSDGIQQSDANAAVGVSVDTNDHSLELVLGGSGNDTLAPANSNETSSTQITLSLDAHPYSEVGDDNIIAVASGKRILDVSSFNIVHGGLGDDDLSAYPTSVLNGTAPATMLMGGIGNDSYTISMPNSDEWTQQTLTQIVDQDGTGQIFVQGNDAAGLYAGDSVLELSNRVYGGWDKGDDGNGDFGTYWWMSDPYIDPDDGTHRSQNTGWEIFFEYEYGDLNVFVTRAFIDPSIQIGNQWQYYEEFNFMIRDFQPGDFGIEFKLWEDGTVFAGAGGPSGDVSMATLDFNGQNGDENDNTLFANADGGTVFGFDGDDVFLTSAVGGNFDGGVGNDSVVYTSAAASVGINLSTGVNSGAAANDEFTSIESIQGSDFNDTIVGDDQDNGLYGGDGDDDISGLAGADTLVGGYGNDTLAGGADGDVYEYLWDGSDLVADDGGTGVDVLKFTGYWSSDASYSYSGTDLQISFYGSDVVTIAAIAQADYQANLIEFFDFADGVTLSMLDVQTSLLQEAVASGSPVVIGTYTDDVLNAGTGNQTISGVGGIDTFSFATGDGLDVITDFDLTTETITIDGVAVDPDSPPSGVTLSQVGADTVIAYGTSDAVTLQNVDLATWINPTTTETQTFADGRVLVTTFDATGARLSATMTDTAAAFVWAEYTDTFDEFDQTASRIMTYDDGRVGATNYVSGVKNTALITDAADVYAWSTVDQQFDTTGERTSQINTYDDGRVLETTYANGTPTTAMMDDVADAYAWLSYTDTFDLSGVREAQTRTYDDGRLLETSYANGVRTTATMTDVADAYVWSDYTDTFDANDAISARLMNYDDGRIGSTTFTGGVRSSAQITDATDQYIWDTIDQLFDVSGVRTEQTNTYDDGRVLETMYVDGIRSTATMTDVNDVYNWASYQDTYDATGALIDRVFTYDDELV